MKNKEKYADEIFDFMAKANDKFPNDSICTYKEKKNCCVDKPGCINNPGVGCDTDLCEKLFKEWLEAEYVPPKTRQSEFLKMFPNARVNNDTKILEICPQELDINFKCPYRNNHKIECSECSEYYWGEEIE